MNAQSTVHGHIDVTETLVRLYVFLAQDLDRCLTRGRTPNLSGAGTSVAAAINTSQDDGNSLGEPGGQGEGGAGV